MMDRVLNAEFQPLRLEDDDIAGDGSWTMVAGSDYQPLPTSIKAYWFSEMKLDLSGYTRDDLTVYFRNSFEQRASSTSLIWNVDDPSNPLKPFDATFLETVILTTVPITPNQLISAAISAPGFNQIGIAALDFGNFNRNHIIHGTNTLWGIDTSFGADALTANGEAFCRIIQTQDFSSLEPTAAENIYCYRVIALPESYNRTSEKGLSSLFLPACRILLNCMIDKEADLEYMMRLKRSYELANQV
jgi:hypothetical protein